jgi:hypothetical protein
MSAMLAIYQVLKALGMQQWHEKRDLGGLGAAPQAMDSRRHGSVDYKESGIDPLYRDEITSPRYDRELDGVMPFPPC